MLALLKSLNAREISILVWIAIGVAWSLRFKETREGLTSFARALIEPYIALAIGTSLVWVTLVVYGLSRFELWQVSILKETIIWALGTATVLFMQIPSAGKDAAFFRRTALKAIGWTVFLQFLLSNYVLPLAVELVLVPILFGLSALWTVAQLKRKHKPVAKLVGAIIAVVSTSMAIFSFLEAYNHRDDFGKFLIYQQLLIGPTLTLFFLPIVYAIALAATYQERLNLLPHWLNGDMERIRLAKREAIRTCGLNLYRVQRLRGKFYLKLSEATGPEVQAVVRRAAFGGYEPLRSRPLGHVRILRSRLVPFRLANGRAAHKAVVDWHNESKLAIGFVRANLVALDAEGEVAYEVKDYSIFFAEREDSAILPGEDYVEPEEEGHVVLRLYGKPATSLDVEITHVDGFQRLNSDLQ